MLIALSSPNIYDCHTRNSLNHIKNSFAEGESEAFYRGVSLTFVSLPSVISFALPEKEPFFKMVRLQNSSDHQRLR